MTQASHKWPKMWKKTSVVHFTKKKRKKKKTFFLVFWRVTRICWSPIKTPKIWDTWPLTWNNLETKPVLENHLWTYPKGETYWKTATFKTFEKSNLETCFVFCYLLHLGISWNALKLFLKRNHERTEASNPALNVLMACLGWLTIGLCPEFSPVATIGKRYTPET